jgi:hypothetical protein
VLLTIRFRGDGFAKLVKDPAKLDQIIAGSALHGKLGRKTLQSASKLAGFLDVAFGEKRYESAAARTYFDQAFDCELLDCLPYRCQAHSELGRNLIYLQAPAWLEYLA